MPRVVERRILPARRPHAGPRSGTTRRPDAQAFISADEGLPEEHEIDTLLTFSKRAAARPAAARRGRRRVGGGMFFGTVAASRRARCGHAAGASQLRRAARHNYNRARRPRSGSARCSTPISRADHLAVISASRAGTAGESGPTARVSEARTDQYTSTAARRADSMALLEGARWWNRLRSAGLSDAFSRLLPVGADRWTSLQHDQLGPRSTRGWTRADRSRIRGRRDHQGDGQLVRCATGRTTDLRSFSRLTNRTETPPSWADRSPHRQLGRTGRPHARHRHVHNSSKGGSR